MIYITIGPQFILISALAMKCSEHVDDYQMYQIHTSFKQCLSFVTDCFGGSKMQVTGYRSQGSGIS